jgi:NitT/TauT family transport system substrate-binding protein
MIGKRTGSITLAAFLLLAPCANVRTQELKTWRHGVIEPKGDAGFSLMVGQRGFAEKHGLKLEIIALKNGATAHKALLAGELDSIESSPGSAILAGAHGADIKIVGCDWPGGSARADGALDNYQDRRPEGQDGGGGLARLAA